MSGSWVLSWDEKPCVENQHRTMHHHQRAKIDGYWRHLFAALARGEGMPKQMQAVTLDVTHERPNRRAMPDVAACAPTLKAALDGLVDYGLVADDSPEHVQAITFRVAVTGRHALTIRIDEVTP